MAIFAGDIPGALLRMPGTPASAAYVHDAYLMTRSGRAEEALGASLVFSSIGGLFGTVVLVTASPALAEVALKFLLVRVFLARAAGACRGAIFISPGSVPRGLVSLIIGLFAATVGIDNPAGQPRYTFDNVELLAGVQFIPAMIGLFAMSEVFRSVLSPSGRPQIESAGHAGIFRTQWANLKRYPVQMIRGSILGTAIGALPGAGADIAAWISYAVSKRMSRTPEKFRHRPRRGPRRGRGLQQRRCIRRLDPCAGLRHPRRLDHRDRDRRPLHQGAESWADDLHQ